MAQAKHPSSLNAANIVHFAAWYPDSSHAIAYSTVEPRPNAPGWQANNDLYKVSIGGQPQKILDASSGGVYGWWGMTFAFSPSGRLAYAKPDGIGLVSQDGGYLAPILDIPPLQTHGDWAWNPGISWGADFADALLHRSRAGARAVDGGRFARCLTSRPFPSTTMRPRT